MKTRFNYTKEKVVMLTFAWPIGVSPRMLRKRLKKLFKHHHPELETIKTSSFYSGYTQSCFGQVTNKDIKTLVAGAINGEILRLTLFVRAKAAIYARKNFIVKDMSEVTAHAYSTLKDQIEEPFLREFIDYWIGSVELGKTCSNCDEVLKINKVGDCFECGLNHIPRSKLQKGVELLMKGKKVDIKKL